MTDFFKERQRVSRAAEDEAFDPLGKLASGVGILRNGECSQIPPFVVRVEKRILDRGGGNGEDRPDRRGQFEPCATLDSQMSSLRRERGGRNAVAGDIMGLSYTCLG